MALRADTPAVSASTRTHVHTAMQQHEAYSASTSTPCHGLGRAVRHLTTGGRNTQPPRSMTRVYWRASASTRLEYMRWHGARLCHNNSGSRSSLTATGAAALPRAAIIGGGSREAAGPPAATAAAAVARRGTSSSTMSEREFHDVADEALEDIHDAVEEALEDGFEEEFDCNMSVGACCEKSTTPHELSEGLLRSRRGHGRPPTAHRPSSPSRTGTCGGVWCFQRATVFCWQVFRLSIPDHRYLTLSSFALHPLLLPPILCVRGAGSPALSQQGVLNIIVGDRGTWVLNKQSPNRQIWWSSPIRWVYSTTCLLLELQLLYTSPATQLPPRKYNGCLVLG